MAYPAKLVNLSALLAKSEATYGTAVAVTSSADGQLLALSDRYPGLFTASYAYDGVVGVSPGNLGMLKRVPAVGRTAAGAIPMRAKGAGTTYAATALPNIHTMLKLSGFDSTLNLGTYTYTPTPESTTYSSATMEAYKRGEKWTLRGVLGSWGFDIGSPGIPLHTFDVMGLLDAAIVDAAMIAPTYPTLSTSEPIAAGLALTIGSYITPVVKSASFKMNRQLEPRLDLTSADAHTGFSPAGYDPEFRVTVESSALVYPTASGGFDPYKMRLNAEQIAVSMTVGSTPYNRYTISMPQSQLKDFTFSNEGPVATTELVFQCNNSSPIVQNDSISVVFN